MRRLLAALVLLALLAPLAGLVLAGRAGEDTAGPLGSSLLVAALATAIATGLGAMAGAGLRGAFPGRLPVLALLALPVLLPPVLPAAALLLAGEFLGRDIRLPGLVLWHALLAAPLVAAITLSSLDGVNPRLFRAAQACGMAPETAARRLLRPALLRAMALGAALAFALSAGESSAALLLGAGTLPAALLAGGAAPLAPVIAALALGVAFLLRGASRPTAPQAPITEEKAP